MKGLLLKDLYMAVKYCRLYAFFTVGFLIVFSIDRESFFFLFYPCLLAGIVPVTLLGYDERSKWHAYSCALPCSRDMAVSVKYIIGLLFQLAVIVLVLVTQAVLAAFSDGMTATDIFLPAAMLVVLSLGSSALTLPFMFRFGVEKGRVAYYVMIGVLCGGTAAVTSVSKGANQFAASAGHLPLFMAAAAILYGISWYISILFYRKREL